MGLHAKCSLKNQGGLRGNLNSFALGKATGRSRLVERTIEVSLVRMEVSLVRMSR